MEFDQFVEPLKECLDGNYILIFVTVLQVSPSAITTIVHLLFRCDIKELGNLILLFLTVKATFHAGSNLSWKVTINQSV